MGIKGSGAVAPTFFTQVPIDYIDTSLVQNTWETVSTNLSGGVPAKLWFIIVEQTNNGATVETIELELTINGTAYTCTLTGIASGVQNYVFLSYNQTAGDFGLVNGTTFRTCNAILGESIPITAKSVGLIRVRQTTDVDGTSAQIEVNIVWEKWQ